MLAYEEFVEAFTGLHGAGRIVVPGPSSWRGLLEWRRSEAFGVTHCGGAQQLMRRDILRAAGTTPRDLIRAERLRLARTRLASPQWASSSIARIAYSCGFRSHATFATAFRHEFGRTPSETRSSGAGSPPSSSGSAPR